MKNSYIQPTLFNLEPYSVSPEPEPIHLTNKRTEPITVYLTPSQKTKLEEKASCEGMTVSAKVRQVIKHWIEELD